jgi:RNA recognition motif-containing protein
VKSNPKISPEKAKILKAKASKKTASVRSAASSSSKNKTKMKKIIPKSLPKKKKVLVTNVPSGITKKELSEFKKMIMSEIQSLLAKPTAVDEGQSESDAIEK